MDYCMKSICFHIILLLLITVICCPVSSEQATPTPYPSASAADLLIQSIDYVMREELVRSVLSEDDEILIAKMLWGEDRENPLYQRAAIVWVVFNRMDAWGYRIDQIVTTNQFAGYHTGNPVKQWAIDLVRDVAMRYVLELNGFTDTGRVLPREYLFFENIPPRRGHVFKTKEKLSDKTNKTWNWALPSPYPD